MITIILAAFIAAILVLTLFWNGTGDQSRLISDTTIEETEVIDDESSEDYAETTAGSTQETTDIPETASIINYDDPVERYLYSIDDIDSMILVIGDQYTINSAVLYYYEKEDGKWICRKSVDAWCGSNGFSDSTYEGDRTTPVGCFEMGIAFGNDPNPGTALEWVDVNENLFWVDDITSEYYDQLIDIREVPNGWNSGEHLIDYIYSYAYSIEIKVNPPYETSAIFLHCDAGGTSTAGCVGIPEDSMIWILQNIKTDTRIAIVEYAEDLDIIEP